MLKTLMNQIHDHMEMPTLSRDFGTQTYEQQVVELSRDGEKQHPAGGHVVGGRTREVLVFSFDLGGGYTHQCQGDLAFGSTKWGVGVNPGLTTCKANGSAALG